MKINLAIESNPETRNVWEMGSEARPKIDFILFNLTEGYMKEGVIVRNGNFYKRDFNPI